MAPFKQRLRMESSKAPQDITKMMSNFSKMIARLEFPQTQCMNLMALPQEIKDIIFDLAYPTIKDFKFVTKEGWDHSEQERFRRSRSGYTSRSFPEPKACDFLVSKMFFVSASIAYVGNQIFDDTVEARTTAAGSILPAGLEAYVSLDNS